MKNKFIQRESGFCTVYALSNMFRDNHFLENFSTEEFRGCNDEQEQVMINSYDNDLSFSEVVSVRHSYDTPLPEKLVYDILLHEDPPASNCNDFDLIPYLVTVRLVAHHKFHHSVVVLNRNSQLYYIDPRNEDIIKIKGDLFKHFIDCWCIKRPYLKSTNMFARISSKALGFSFEY
jgi:hypothetical protein